MGKHRKSDTPVEDLDYEVGYRKPPRQHTFKANNNANPKGRPRAEEGETITQVVNKVLNKRLKAPMDREAITLRENLVNAQAAKGSQGDTKATAFLFSYSERPVQAGSAAAVQSEPDRQIIQHHIKELLAQRQRKE